MLGLELAIAGRHDEAMVHLRAATPGYPKAHYHLGGELFNERRLDEAIAELETFVQQEPLAVEAVSARTILGQAFMSQKKWPQAVEQFRLVLSMTSPRSAAHTTAMGLLADSLFGQERYDEAVTYYRTYLSLRPTDVGGASNLGISLVATGKADEALAAFRRATDAGPRDVRARRNLAMALFDHGDLDGARVEFERALQLDPNDVQARKDLEQVLLALRSRDRD
jgi:tetratricopeptide (TPR) repeat protein